jgi:hypothetical protein
MDGSFYPVLYFPRQKTPFIFGSVSGYIQLSFWQEQTVDKDEYGALLE